MKIPSLLKRLFCYGHGLVNNKENVASQNELRRAKPEHSLNVPETLVQSSRAPADPTRPGPSSSTGPKSTASSSSLHFSKTTCAICLNRITKEGGKAIFTAECSHSFHFKCITSNVKHGNRICPLCRTQWKQVPLCDDNNNPAPTIPPAPAPTPAPTPTPSQTGFEDDEILPQVEAQIHGPSGSGVARRQALEVNLFPEVSAVAKSVTRSDFAVLVHLKAEEGVGGDATRTHVPLDLVTVLDVSGSMDGTKMTLMKNAMSFVIQNLGENDRLSVVAFATIAQRIFPLRLMTETGKQAALQAVNSLFASGGTNIAQGLKIGARVIAERRWQNPVSGMMLLSDGHHPFSPYGSLNAESLIPSFSRVPIHTFGFGLDHDSALMHTISQVSSGTFSFIETETVIQDAFAQCIGGLLSVVMLDQVVEIECVHEEGLKISSVKAGSYRSRVASDARTATIDVGVMYAEEERDFIVMLEVPPGSAESEPMPLLKVRCVYKDPVTNETVRVESGELTIQRPVELTGEEVVSIEVDRQRNRFLVSQEMSEARVLADRGELSAAVELLQNRERELSETVSAQSSDRLVQSLSSELRALQARMSSRRTYHSTGQGYLFSSMSSHLTQRATARGNSTTLDSSVEAYQTSQMASMVSRSQLLRVIDNPDPSSTSSSPARGETEAEI